LGVLQPCSPDSVVWSVLAVDEILNEDRKVSDPGVEADRDGSGQWWQHERGRGSDLATSLT
jgi:hypothetical protein